jgi:D-alanyl-lipoteichoic acid acyltransferase DltB (MBOAT superfamily)
MVFNSLPFLIFFTAFFLLYWFVVNKNIKLQNLLLLVGSYFFYAWADWRFVSFLFGVSALNFYLGIHIEKAKNPTYKKVLLYIGLLEGIGGLVFFKYYNFFVTSFKDLFQVLNINLNLQTLNIIVPLGISFFTFRTISYLLDIDKGKIQSTKDWIVFFNYVSFFPALLAGPIDKAKSFVPQLEKERTFDYNSASDGLRQILWGLFKKVVIADNCATVTNIIFDNYQSLPASSLLLGGFLYTIQIYADFSGYSDMAIGFSRLIGFNISKNFDFPFFSQNIAEFWRKWHMSLTLWLTEYVFTPLSIKLRDYDKLGLIFAIVINFTICGIWHGANWTYVLFGFLHGCYFIPLILKGTMNKKKKIAKDKLLPSFREFINMLMTFSIVMFTFIIFRSETIQQAFHYYRDLFSLSIFTNPILPISLSISHAIRIALFISIMFILEWLNREKEFGLQINYIERPYFRLCIYYAILFSILFFGAFTSSEFIYFNF